MENDMHTLYVSFQNRVGTEIAAGAWLTIDQARIDLFAEATGDHQWIHVDCERAAHESPYKSTIAHGFLTLSLLPFLTQSNTPHFFSTNYPGMRYRVNYGLNKVRFPAAVRPGDRIRARTGIVSCTLLDTCLEITYLLTVDIDGQPKPACIAEQLVRVYP